METLKIDIVNPKAKKIIKELADLKLITIRDASSTKSFTSLLKKLRSRNPDISLNEITKEVEAVRSKRHGN
ncbi:MAG: hypothetical protein R2820_06080 [Cyclobacteriaceae bacterium]|nr:hypothetical protein [Cyclobacteriaceae bacterium]